MMNRADANKALLEAVQYGEVGGVRDALAAGADPDAENEEGETACKVAVFWGCLDVLELLLDAGADLEHPFWDSGFNDGVVPIYRAAVKKAKERGIRLREAQRLDRAVGPGLVVARCGRLRL